MANLGSGNGTTYPASLDIQSTPEVDSPSANKTKARAAVPNDLAAAVIAVETALGTNPQGITADVKTFLQTEHYNNGKHNIITSNDIVTKSPIPDVRAFLAKGDGVTNDDAAFTAAAVSGIPTYVPLTSSFYVKTTYPAGKFYGPGLIKVNGVYFPIPRNLNMTGAVWGGRNDNIQGGWFWVAPDGTIINTTGTTTQGLQEAINYAGLNGFNLKLEGGGITTGVGGINYAAIVCANNLNPVLSIPTINMGEIDLGTVWLQLSPQTASNDGIGFNTLDTATFKHRGQLIYVYPGTGTLGSAVRINPTTTNGEGGFIGVTASCLEFGSIVITNTAFAAINTQGVGMRFSMGSGYIINAEFRAQEINGGLTGFQVDTPTGTNFFKGNRISCPAVHNQGSTSVAVGSSSTAQISWNTWDVIMEPVVQGLLTYAKKDTYRITVDGGSGPGINFGSSAAMCSVYAADIGAGGISDNSTALSNKVYYNGTRGAVGISVGASPFTYTNKDALTETVFVQGGTVSAITALSVFTGLTQGSWVLEPGDTLTVTYTAAPGMSVVKSNIA